MDTKIVADIEHVQSCYTKFSKSQVTRIFGELGNRWGFRTNTATTPSNADQQKNASTDCF
jgi:hypothetical protein